MAAETPRKTVILLDRSGSMQGAPLAQARKAIQACLAVLNEEDTFGLVAFDDRVEAMDSELLPGTRENRDRASGFLSRVYARGGTELARGFTAAARLLSGGGDVVVLTDGQVFGTEKFLAQARAANVRMFCLGIASASQDRFLSLLARETGGISRFVTAKERVDMAAVDLFASMGRPVATGLKAGANVQPKPPGAVFGGTPALLFGEIEGTGPDVELTWEGGRLTIPVPAGDEETGEMVRLLRGSRLITDWESRYPGEEALAPVAKRTQFRVAARLAELSRDYALASREMSLVAVVKRAGDRPGELPETRVVPVGMPEDTNFGAYFGTQAMASMIMAPAPASRPPKFGLDMLAYRRAPETGTPLFARIAKHVVSGVPEPPSEEDQLMDLAAQLEADGGMPGDTPSARVARTVAALLAFLAAGHTATAGVFRSHVARLAEFLGSARGLPEQETRVVERALDAALRGTTIPGPWIAIARGVPSAWSRIQRQIPVC